MKNLYFCITYDIATYINDGFDRKSVNLWSFYDVPSFLNFYINIPEYANYIICISEHVM